MAIKTQKTIWDSGGQPLSFAYHPWTGEFLVVPMYSYSFEDMIQKFSKKSRSFDEWVTGNYFPRQYLSVVDSPEDDPSLKSFQLLEGKLIQLGFTGTEQAVVGGVFTTVDNLYNTARTQGGQEG